MNTNELQNVPDFEIETKKIDFDWILFKTTESQLDAVSYWYHSEAQMYAVVVIFLVH